MLLQPLKNTARASLNALRDGIKFSFDVMPYFIKKQIRKVVVDTTAQQKVLDEIFDLLTPTTQREAQKRIFKKNVSLVEIEVASFCNRTCWFCPNSFVDRKSTSVELDEEAYLRILDDLKEIDYDMQLNFHRFNEPLANKELILRRIKQARERLPKASLNIFTNGDYLDYTYIQELESAGLSGILMSYYFNKETDFDVKNVIAPNMKKVTQKLGVKFSVIRNDEIEFGMGGKYKNLSIYYRAWNPKTVASNRGGSVKEADKFNPKNSENYGGCFQLAWGFYIDYNGLVMPCCNTRSDVEAHKSFVLGDVYKDSIFDIYMSEKFCGMRRMLFRGHIDNPICKGCNKDYRTGLGRIVAEIK